MRREQQIHDHNKFSVTDAAGYLHIPIERRD
jgi:hypothetical protein